MITCHSILKATISKDNHDLIAACLGAEAARFAGWLTLSAVLGAIVAAVIGAWAAYRAALVQERLQRAQHEARVTAYWWHLRVVLGPVLDQMEQAVVAALRLRSGEATLPKPIPLPAELSDDRWENHALLGESAVSELAASAEFLRRYNLLMSNESATANENVPSIDFVEDEVGKPEPSTRRERVLRCCDELTIRISGLTAVHDTPPSGARAFGPIWISRSVLAGQTQPKTPAADAP